MIHYPVTYETLARLFSTGTGPIAFDIETSGFDPYTCRVCLAQFSFGDDNVYIFDALRDDFTPVAKLIGACTRVIIGQNLKFENLFLMCLYGQEIQRPFDTFKASYLYYNGLVKGHNLFDIKTRELGISPLKDMSDSNWSARPLSSEQLQYAAFDADRDMHRLREALIRKLYAKDLIRVAVIEFDVIACEAEIELEGLPLDKSMWTKLYVENQVLHRRQSERLWSILPCPDPQLGLFGPVGWNLASVPMMSKALREAGCIVEDTSAPTLMLSDHPAAAEVVKWRKLQKLTTTYGIEYLKHIHPVTGRIHTRLWPFTIAGRYSSGGKDRNAEGKKVAGVNLQQIPRDARFRNCFRGDLIVYDFGQIELRVAAEVSGCPVLTKVYDDDGDAHTTTAGMVASGQEVTKAFRQMAKAINFGFIYGMGAPKFKNYAKTQYGASFTLEEAYHFREAFLDLYPGIRRWHHDILGHKHRSGRVSRTLAGRWIYHESEQEYSEYANYRVQGTAGDIIKRAMKLCRDRLQGRGKVAMTVHDELMVIGPAELAPIVKGAMEDAGREILRRVPVKAEGGAVKSWSH